MANKEPEVLDPLEEGMTVVHEDSALRAITGGETDVQIATAKKFPRSITNFRKEATELVTLDEETAGSCIYALPRGGKTLEGPSARFAEVILYSFKNVRVQSQVIGEDGKFVTVRGMAWDIQNNVAKAVEVKRRICDKSGRKFNDDMIGVTTAAASVIAIRNATLQLIPKALWQPMYLSAREVIAGNAETLSSRRDKLLAYFLKLGVANAKVFVACGVNGIEEITLDHMVTLRGFATAIKDGEKTIEEFFGDDPGNSATVDPLDEYLEPYEKAVQADVIDLVKRSKMNKGQLTAKLKQFAGKSAEFIAELRKVVASIEAKPKKEDVKSEPAKQTDAPVVPAEKVEAPNVKDILF